MSVVDAETKQLMDEIYRDKVRRAKETPMDVKILDGPRLFDMNCMMARAGIRVQNPSFNEEQVEQELVRRLAIARQIADRGIYRPVEEGDE